MRVRAGTQHVLVPVLATRRRVCAFYLFTHFLICLDRRGHVLISVRRCSHSTGRLSHSTAQSTNGEMKQLYRIRYYIAI
jgi:hypothetical protein